MRENAENGFENTQIILVLSGNRFSYHGDGVYEIDHREEAHFDRLAADLKRGKCPTPWFTGGRVICLPEK